MVVCRCRKATKLYCFVHKAPVCGDCISSPEHQLCVVKTYSDWVIDGDYDWPPVCALCRQILQESDDVTRLGCFDILHSKCLEAHLRSFPPHTAPAGYSCPSCSTPIWPPKFVKEPNSALHSKLKQIITQSGVATTLLGSDLNTPSAQRGAAPPAFSSSPLVSTAAVPLEENAPSASASGEPISQDDNIRGAAAPPTDDSQHVHESSSFSGADASSSAGPPNNLGSVPPGSHFTKGGPHTTIQLPNGTTTARKHRDSVNPANLDYDDDDADESHRKYSSRGPLYKQLLRSVLPFWSPALHSLPVTAPSYKDRRDGPGAEDINDGRSRRKQRNAEVLDSKRILLWLAIMSCMATVVLMYYRLAQGFGSSAKGQSVSGKL